MIERATANIMMFVDTECQQYIIEGNHILPAFAARYADQQAIVSCFFKVSDERLYRSLISGPTHRRNLAPDELQITRYIHDYIGNQAEAYHLPVFEYDQTDDALEMLSRKLGSLIAKV